MTRAAASPFLPGLALLFLLVPAAVPAQAQIFKLQGGDSTLFQAEGGSLDVKAPNYEGNLGLGFFEGHFQLGATMRTKFRDYTLIGGDDSIRFDLPTDIFDGGYYFYARGAGIARIEKNESLYFFGGVTSTWQGTSFFQSAHAENPTAILFFDRRLTRNLHFYSRGILAHRKTSLQSLEWQPRRWLKTAVTAGLGSGKGYFAASLDAETRKLAVLASYVAASQEFRRVTVPSILNSEADKENVQVTYRPNAVLNFSAGHRNLLQPFSFQSPLEEASVNNAGVNIHIAHIYFGTGLFNSSVAGRQTNGANFYAGHRFRDRLELTANYFESRSGASGRQSMVTGTFREIVSPRFSLLQLVTHSNGQWNLAYGGQYVANRFRASVDYQNVYLPFQPQHPFQQALTVNVTARLLGPLQLNAGSAVAPDGHIRYTFGATTYFYRYSGLMGAQGPSADSYSFPKYLVQGIVKDDSGKPFSGAALHINGATVYSDDAGRFLYRCRKRTPMKLEVAPEEFLVPGVYRVVQSPSVVMPETEERATDVLIVVQPARTTPIELRVGTPRGPGTTVATPPQAPAPKSNPPNP
jgi:hypothetical protein